MYIRCTYIHRMYTRCMYIHRVYIHRMYTHCMYTSYIHTLYVHTSYAHTSHVHASYVHTSYVHTSYVHTSYAHASHVRKLVGKCSFIPRSFINSLIDITELHFVLLKIVIGLFRIITHLAILPIKVYIFCLAMHILTSALGAFAGC